VTVNDDFPPYTPGASPEDTSTAELPTFPDRPESSVSREPLLPPPRDSSGSSPRPMYSPEFMGARRTPITPEQIRQQREAIRHQLREQQEAAQPGYSRSTNLHAPSGYGASASHVEALDQPSLPLPEGLPQPRRIRKRALVLISALGIVVGLVLFVIAGVLTGQFQSKIATPPVGAAALPWNAQKPVALEDMIILAMGVDLNYDSNITQRYKNCRTDTMLLVRVNGRNHSVSAVSVPRDSRVYIGNRDRVDKINAAYQYGGIETVIDTIHRSFGIPVDRYLMVDQNAIIDVVDTLGGVDIVVDKAMHYTDHTAKLYIDFAPGPQHLDGKKAAAFLRFRHDALGDIGRTHRQQQFVKAFIEQLKTPLGFTKIPGLISVAASAIQTNLSPYELLQLAWFSKDMNPNQFRVATLPGKPSNGNISYWLLDPDRTELILDRLILDNLGAQAFEDTTSPLRVGVLYPRNTPDTQRQQLVEQLTAQGFTVACQSPIRQAPGTPRLIEHTARTRDAITDKLMGLTPLLQGGTVIFAPAGGSFEVYNCSIGEDYTLILPRPPQP